MLSIIDIMDHKHIIYINHLNKLWIEEHKIDT